jgi:hypothetical protein
MRRILQTGVVCALLLAAVLSSAARAASRMIVYIGARDCGPCRQWENTYLRGFQAHCAARGIAFRQVHVATLMNIRDTHYWPPELRPLLAQFPDRAHTPHFLAVLNGRVVVNASGLRGFEREIAPLAR